MDPVAFTLFGMDVRWYGILIALGIICAVAVACFNAPKRGFSKDDPFELIIWLFPMAIIGARLYFLIFNNGPWDWNAFAIWNGGIAIYGAIIGGAIGGLLYCWIRKKNFILLADLVAPSLILGQAIGRWGNFVNQEAFGEVVTNPNLHFFPYAVYIDRLEEWHQATFFYESLGDILIFIALLVIIRKVNWKGIVMSSYMVLYGILRFFVEGMRTDSLMWGALRVSQWLSLLIVVVGIGLIIYLIVKNKHKKQDVVGDVDDRAKKRKIASGV